MRRVQSGWLNVVSSVRQYISNEKATLLPYLNVDYNFVVISAFFLFHLISYKIVVARCTSACDRTAGGPRHLGRAMDNQTLSPLQIAPKTIPNNTTITTTPSYQKRKRDLCLFQTEREKVIIRAIINFIPVLLSLFPKMLLFTPVQQCDDLDDLTWVII